MSDIKEMSTEDLKNEALALHQLISLDAVADGPKDIARFYALIRELETRGIKHTVVASLHFEEA